jgi:hypothetical protein
MTVLCLATVHGNGPRTFLFFAFVDLFFYVYSSTIMMPILEAKENKLFLNMKVSGLGLHAYWKSNFIIEYKIQGNVYT